MDEAVFRRRRCPLRAHIGAHRGRRRRRRGLGLYWTYQGARASERRGRDGDICSDTSPCFGWRISSRGGLAAAARRASAGTRGLPPPRAAAVVAVASPRPQSYNHNPAGGLHPRGSTRNGRTTYGRRTPHQSSHHLSIGSPPAASQFDLWAVHS